MRTFALITFLALMLAGCQSAATTAPTGVEMEALTAATVAALTVYDMTKALDKSIEIQDVYLLEKTGGKSGVYRRPERAG